MSLRSSTNNDVKIPEKPAKKCTGFTYSGAKLFNLLPGDIKKCLNSNKFKSMIKEWIWREIPSYYTVVLSCEWEKKNVTAI